MHNDGGQPEIHRVGGLPGFARFLAPALTVLRKAFQRGLGGAGVCTRATITFDDASSPATLSFHVELWGEERVFSETVTDWWGEAKEAAEERGAACATAVQAGLIKPGQRKPEADGRA